MSGINQKEYLKKYLGIGKGAGDKKKKKKKSRKLGSGLKIVDDDVDVDMNEEIKVDLSADNDEAPQIVSVIDDRPPSLRIDEETHSKLWKPIGVPDVSEQTEKSIEFKGHIKLSSLGNKHALGMSKRDLSPSRKHKESRKSSGKSSARINKDVLSPIREGSSQMESKNSTTSSAHDLSPVRQHRIPDISPPRKGSIQVDSDMDNSPPRRGFIDSSPPRRTKYNDNSPPRRSKIDRDTSPPRKRRTQDDSSLQKKQSKDRSPPRRTYIDSDSSRPRKDRDKAPRDLSPSRQRIITETYPSPPRRIKMKKTVDNSPPRKRKTNDDFSPQRKRSKDISPPRRTTADGDFSPPRRNKAKAHGDLSSPREGKIAKTDTTPIVIKLEKNVDNSPPRRRGANSPARKKSRWGDSEEASEKMEKTLDGKVAGLQNAADLVKETQELKKREDELFKKLSAEVSGANAATIVRRKHTDVDPEEEEKKRKLEEENKEKYSRWGRGLKQVGDSNEKMKNELYEMSKPLARYADDEDLEKHLKDQEREGDPMLAYIRQKKKKNAVEKGAPAIQQYEGDAPPNRFGIRPGYRWDGVDRSSGYEKRWFEEQNSRQASMEENYKWSTEDM